MPKYDTSMGCLANTRRFQLVREEDAKGQSGTGVVAEGVEFHDGQVAMKWSRSPAMIKIADSIDDVLTVHSHGDTTAVRWIDGG